LTAWTAGQRCTNARRRITISQARKSVLDPAIHDQEQHSERAADSGGVSVSRMFSFTDLVRYLPSATQVFMPVLTRCRYRNVANYGNPERTDNRTEINRDPAVHQQDAGPFHTGRTRHTGGLFLGSGH
jgi:hypothetical protein